MTNERDSPSTGKLFGANARLSRLIRARREERGWSQQDLADAAQEAGLGWIQSTVNRIEHGERNISLDEVGSVAALLGIGIEAILDADLQRLKVRRAELGSLAKEAETEAAEAEARFKRLMVEFLDVDQAISALQKKHLAEGLEGLEERAKKRKGS